MDTRAVEGYSAGVTAYSVGETARILQLAGVTKAKQPLSHLFIKSFLAGAYLSFGGLLLEIMIAGSPGLKAEYPGQKILGALVFPIGLIIIVLTGAELVTSNMMIFIMSGLARKTTFLDLVKSWVVSWIGNLAGALFWGGIVVFYGGILEADPYKAGSIALSVSKVVTPAWHQIFFRAIGCNWLVCLAIWLSTSAKDLQSKVIGAYLPIFAFVGVGFEHVRRDRFLAWLNSQVVANMFIVQIGMYNGAPIGVGLYIWKSMLPVTLGNIIGGSFFVGGIYYFLHLRAEIGDTGGPSATPGSSGLPMHHVYNKEINGSSHSGDGATVA